VLLVGDHEFRQLVVVVSVCSSIYPLEAPIGEAGTVDSGLGSFTLDRTIGSILGTTDRPVCVAEQGETRC
jgi:hypothetical protein